VNDRVSIVDFDSAAREVAAAFCTLLSTTDEPIETAEPRVMFVVRRGDSSVERYDLEDGQDREFTIRLTEPADRLDRLVYERAEGGVPNEH
jgi:hypothetical protein